METLRIFILGAVVILAVVFFFLRKSRGTKKLTPLGGIAFGFVLAGIIFKNTQVISYALIGTGVGLAVMDIVLKLKKK